MAEMTEVQREFWRALTAPFPRNSYKVRDDAKGKRFTYLDSRTIENRLDDVVGPGNWDLKQFETSRGVIAELILEVPDRDGNLKRVSRTGGGGFCQLQDDDSSYKSGFTSSFRSAATRFGIGRDLYGNGMPAYCADLHGGMASGMPATGPGAGPPPPESRPNGTRNDPGGGGDRQYDRFKPPYGRPGKAPYAWAKQMSEHFRIDVLGRMMRYAEERGKPKYTDKWDVGFLDECLRYTIDWIKSLDHYDGEFGPASDEQPALDKTPAPAPMQGQPHSLVEPITAAVNALLLKQTGQAPEPFDIIACIQELACSVPNGQGVRGEVMQSLRNCQDGVWLKNILNAANKRVQEAALLNDDSPAEEDDIPF